MLPSDISELAKFSFTLPHELIAQSPPAARSASRLLLTGGSSNQFSSHFFNELPHLLQPGDLLVLNDTRVINARLYALKESGGKCEILVERILDSCSFRGQIRASHPPQLHDLVSVDHRTKLEITGKTDRFFDFRLQPNAGPGGPINVNELLDQFGQLPLPPYIKKLPDATDIERYQTIYATNPGSVAAPTAGLHFDPPLFERLQKKGISWASLTLHIGAGTFLPVQSGDLKNHVMHKENYSIPTETANAIIKTKAQGGRIIAVGTTALRALESAASISPRLEVQNHETDLFITPGFSFRIVDGLITNFHLPRSTLFILVCAFLGLDQAQNAYQTAIREGYRFYSYGDAMFALRNPQ